MALWQAVPLTLRRAPALFVPRRCRQLAADLLTRELKAAALCLAAKKDDIRAQVIHLRIHAMPQLLFRVPYRHFPQSADEPNAEGRVEYRDGHQPAETIKSRLIMAFREARPNLAFSRRRQSP